MSKQKIISTITLRFLSTSAVIIREFTTLMVCCSAETISEVRRIESDQLSGVFVGFFKTSLRNNWHRPRKAFNGNRLKNSGDSNTVPGPPVPRLRPLTAASTPAQPPPHLPGADQRRHHAHVRRQEELQPHDEDAQHRVCHQLQGVVDQLKEKGDRSDAGCP